MGYELIDVRPMTKRIGAEIFGVDLREPLGNQAYAEIHDALMKHQVVFFRDQEIDHEAHKALGRAFGDLHMHSAVKGLDDHPEVVAIHADEHSKFVAGEKWHSDLSCDPDPPMGSILYMHTLPEFGGDTLFTSMYAAYDGLSEPMKAFLEPLTAVHDANPVYKALFPDVDKTYECNSHPVIRVRPTRRRSTSCRRRRAMPCSRSSMSTSRTPTTTSAFAGSRTRSRSGTTAARNTSRCGIISPRPAPAIA